MVTFSTGLPDTERLLNCRLTWHVGGKVKESLFPAKFDQSLEDGMVRLLVGPTPKVPVYHIMVLPAGTEWEYATEKA